MRVNPQIEDMSRPNWNDRAIKVDRKIYESFVANIQLGGRKSKSGYFTVVNKSVIDCAFGPIPAGVRKFIRTTYSMFAQFDGNTREVFPSLELDPMSAIQSGFYETPEGYKHLNSYVIGLRGGEATSVVQGYDAATGMYNVTGMDYPLLDPTQFYPTESAFRVNQLFDLRNKRFHGGTLLSDRNTMYLAPALDTVVDLVEEGLDDENESLALQIRQRMTLDEAIILNEIPLELMIHNVIPNVDSLVVIFDSIRGVNFKNVYPSFEEGRDIVLKDLVRVGRKFNDISEKLHRIFGTVKIYYYYSAHHEYIWLVRMVDGEKRIVRMSLNKGDIIDHFLTFHETQTDRILATNPPS